MYHIQRDFCTNFLPKELQRDSPGSISPLIYLLCPPVALQKRTVTGSTVALAPISLPSLPSASPFSPAALSRFTIEVHLKKHPKHDYDRDKCLNFFQAYRDCMKKYGFAESLTQSRSEMVQSVLVRRLRPPSSLFGSTIQARIRVS